MVKCYLNLSIFTVFLKNKNIIFKIRRSKVTDYAALIGKTDMVLGKKWLFLIGNGAENQPLEKGRKSPVGIVH